MGNLKVKEVATQIKNIELVREKRLKIAMGASKLFIKKGYFRTSMREISKASGLTIGNLYDYITKKEDVLYLVFDVFHSIWVNRLEEQGVFKIEDPVKQLKSAIQNMLELVNEQRAMVLVMYVESKSLPKYFLKIILGKESGLIECFEKILKRGIEKEVFKIKDPFLVANIIVYLLSLEPLRGWSLRRHYKIVEIDKFITNFILDNVIKGKHIQKYGASKIKVDTKELI